MHVSLQLNDCSVPYVPELYVPQVAVCLILTLNNPPRLKSKLNTLLVSDGCNNSTLLDG